MSVQKMPKQGSEPITEVCPNCEGTEFSVERREQKFLYGREGEASELTAEVPVHQCKSCGFEFTGEEAEEARHEAVCRYLRVMTPREILALRKKYEMTRTEFGELSRLGTASLARWETGVLIQNGANDQLLYLLQFEENVALLNDRDALAGGVPCGSAEAHAAGRIAAQGEGGRRLRLRRCPLRGRFRSVDRPDERRVAAAGWRP